VGRFGEHREIVMGREAAVADTPLRRLLGLAWLDESEAPEALWIPRCRSVHTVGMRFPIDLYWLDAGGGLLRAERGVRSRRLAACRAAAGALEVPAGGWSQVGSASA
jgi:uncharacterized membrane protein (UPF0127 family)